MSPRRPAGLVLLLLSGLGAAPTALAGDAAPAPGAEARVLSCGHSSTVHLSVYTWEEAEGRVTLRLRTAALDTGAKVPRLRGKPPVGCPFGLPGPDAEWALNDVTHWARTAAGWVDAQGKPVTVRCRERTVKAVRDATALVANPRSDGCGGERQLILKGGPRVSTPVVRCVVEQPGEHAVTVTFGVELVASENDCGGGSDWRVPGARR